MKRILIIFSILLLVGISIWIWWVVPTRMVKIVPGDVQTIKIFNGNTGEEIVVSERADIEHIIEHFA